jgi:hypothetical protein
MLKPLLLPDDVEAVLQLSSLTRLSDLQISVRANSFELAADAWPRLPSLRGLQVDFSCWGIFSPLRYKLRVPTLPILPKLTALQHLRLLHSELATDRSSSNTVADVFRGLRGLQSLGLQDCVVGVEESNSSTLLAGMVAAIASLPELRDLRLIDMRQWDEAASVALSAATQLTGLVLHGEMFASLVAQQVPKLHGLCSLWAGSDKSPDEFVALLNVEAVATT